MVSIPGYDQVHFVGNHHKLMGNGPTLFWGNVAVNGDSAPWAQAGMGSTYIYQLDGHVREYRKMEDNKFDSDWVLVEGILSETVLYSDFTDGGGAAGTFTSALELPLGAVVTRTIVDNVVGFTGNTSAALTVGDGTDADRYNTGTPSVFTTIAALDVGAVSGTAYHAAAKVPVLTVTANSDWGLVTAGKLTYRIFYYA